MREAAAYTHVPPNGRGQHTKRALFAHHTQPAQTFSQLTNQRPGRRGWAGGHGRERQVAAEPRAPLRAPSLAAAGAAHRPERGVLLPRPPPSSFLFSFSRFPPSFFPLFFSLFFSPLFFPLFLRAPRSPPFSSPLIFPFKRWRAERAGEGTRAREGEEEKQPKNREKKKESRSCVGSGVPRGRGCARPGRLRALGETGRGEQKMEKKQQKKQQKKRVGRSGGAGRKSMARLQQPRRALLHCRRAQRLRGRGERRGALARRRSGRREKGKKKKKYEKNSALAFPKWVFAFLPLRPRPPSLQKPWPSASNAHPSI